MSFRFHDVDDLALEREEFAPHKKGTWRLVVLAMCFLLFASAGYVTIRYNDIIDRLGNAEERFKEVESWAAKQDFRKHTSQDPRFTVQSRKVVNARTGMGE